MASIKNRNFGLDVIRFFAIWLVLLQHGGFTIIPNLQGLKIGGFGVEIFFVLSGYLIGGILIKTLEKENNIRSIWSFWVKRWFRILPVYYLMLAIKYFLFDDSVGFNILYYIFFLQNNFYGISFYGVTWSLVIEEWFYLLAPIFMYLVFKVFNLKHYRLLSFVAFITLILFLRIIYVYKYNVPYGGINGNVPFRLDSLFVGVILSYIKIHFITLYKALSRWWVFSISVAILISYLFFISKLPSYGSSINSFLFTRTVGFSFVSIFAALIIPYCESSIYLDKTRIFPRLVFQLITYTSLFTYAIYLIHPLVFHTILGFNSFSEYKVVNFLIAMLITYVLAIIVYYGYEAKWLKLREKIYSK